MELSDKEKAKIDYEIKAKREDREKELFEWVSAAFKIILFFAFAVFVLKIISNP